MRTAAASPVLRAAWTPLLALGLAPLACVNPGPIGGSFSVGGPTGPNQTSTMALTTTLGSDFTTSEGTTDGPTGTSDSSSSGTTQPPFPARYAVTADFLDGALSVVDLDALVRTGDRDASLYGVVDVSEFTPGPLEVELTPDGATAVVSISPGFFQGSVGETLNFPEIPGGGALLIVDVESLSVTHSLAPADVPMGIAINGAGTRAFTANYGDQDNPGTTMSIVDIEAGEVIVDVEVGVQPEQVALADGDAMGIINVVGDGAVRVFTIAGDLVTLSDPLPVSDDPSGVAFLPDAALAVVANSQGSPNYTLVNVLDPLNPTVFEQGASPGGIPYGVGVLEPELVLLPSTLFGSLRLSWVDLGAVPSEVSAQADIMGANAFPLGLAVASDGTGLMAATGSGMLYVIDTEATEVTGQIQWTSSASPSYVAVHG